MIIDNNNSAWDDATKRAVDDDGDAEGVACDDTLDDKIVLMDGGTDNVGMLGTLPPCLPPPALLSSTSVVM